jgi:hypothetical protein
MLTKGHARHVQQPDRLSVHQLIVFIETADPEGIALIYVAATDVEHRVQTGPLCLGVAQAAIRHEIIPYFHTHAGGTQFVYNVRDVYNHAEETES